MEGVLPLLGWLTGVRVTDKESKNVINCIYVLSVTWLSRRELWSRIYAGLVWLWPRIKTYSSCKICQKEGPFGNSVFAAEEIKGGECLVRIPAAQMISTQKASQYLYAKFGTEVTPWVKNANFVTRVLLTIIFSTRLNGNESLALFLYFESQESSSPDRWIINEIPKSISCPFMLSKEFLKIEWKIQIDTLENSLPRKHAWEPIWHKLVGINLYLLIRS